MQLKAVKFYDMSFALDDKPGNIAPLAKVSPACKNEDF
jgi:hypothetical protein